MEVNQLGGFDNRMTAQNFVSVDQTGAFLARYSQTVTADRAVRFARDTW
jgi:hypothetical protein